MLVARNSPLAARYKSISLKKLLTYPLAFYSPYSLKDNHLFLLLNTIGPPNVKYCVSNLQAFYQLVEKNNCAALGVQGKKIKTSDRFTAIPVRDDIELYSCWVVHSKIQNTPLLQTFLECYNQLRDTLD